MTTVQSAELARHDSTARPLTDRLRARAAQALAAAVTVLVATVRREWSSLRAVVLQWWRDLEATSPRWFMTLFGTWVLLSSVLAAVGLLVGFVRLRLT